MKYFKFQIYGIVQGVGFRPFILNEARKFSLKGYVQNLGDCVLIISNNKEKIFEILNYLPKLAKINQIDCEEIEIENKFENFTIKISENSKLNYSPLPADLNLCEDCLFELFEEGNLRKNYFFISCVNCGPRFSIIKTTPYD
ncbi:carbamoyltransferase HypF, partial [bacterium]|nr:carbamoyltransferase HypF [bacterium]